MKKVFHIVPTFEIGGVEIAIEKSIPHFKEQIDLSLFYVLRKGRLNVGQLHFVKAFRHLFFDRPDIVITSLWYAHPIGLIFKIFGVKWVCFIHNAETTHILDHFIIVMSIWLADANAADSNQTAAYIRSQKTNADVHIIPYKFPTPFNKLPNKRIKNSFIFVGRGAKQKRLDLVIKFLHGIMKEFYDSTCHFIIAGNIPDSVTNLSNLYKNRIVIESNIPNNEVTDRLLCSEYFIVLSDYEGFCMAAYEAVQAGCFIIYRDVGEIKMYVIPNMSFQVTDDSSIGHLIEILVKRNAPLQTVIENESTISFQEGNESTYVSSMLDLINSSCV